MTLPKKLQALRLDYAGSAAGDYKTAWLDSAGNTSGRPGTQAVENLVVRDLLASGSVDALRCPITLDIPQHPVLVFAANKAVDPHTRYERAALIQWLNTRYCLPMQPYTALPSQVVLRADYLVQELCLATMEHARPPHTNSLPANTVVHGPTKRDFDTTLRHASTLIDRAVPTMFGAALAGTVLGLVDYSVRAIALHAGWSLTPHTAPQPPSVAEGMRGALAVGVLSVIMTGSGWIVYGAALLCSSR